MQVLADYADLGYPGALVDARTEEAGRTVRALIAGRLAAFAGHSGVGKSTLVNTVTGGEQQTGAVNEVIGRGRHTTTAARLIHGTGIEVIDTPGIRGFSPAGLEPRELGSSRSPRSPRRPPAAGSARVSTPARPAARSRAPSIRAASRATASCSPSCAATSRSRTNPRRGERRPGGTSPMQIS